MTLLSTDAFSQAALVCFEINIFNTVIRYWNDSIHEAVFISVLIVVYFLLNIWSVSFFGEQLPLSELPFSTSSAFVCRRIPPSNVSSAVGSPVALREITKILANGLLYLFLRDKKLMP